MSVGELVLQWLGVLGLVTGLFVVPQLPGYRRGFRPLRRPPSLAPPRHTFDEDGSSTFTASSQIGFWSRSWPVEVTIDPTWTRIRGLWLDRSLVTGIRTWRVFRSTGFMFDSADGRYDGVMLWSTRPSRVTAIFLHHGWPTPRPAPVRWRRRRGTNAGPAPEAGS